MRKTGVGSIRQDVSDLMADLGVGIDPIVYFTMLPDVEIMNGRGASPPRTDGIRARTMIRLVNGVESNDNDV